MKQPEPADRTDQRQYWDGVADSVGDGRGQIRGEALAHLSPECRAFLDRAVLRLIGPQHHDVVLDAGCGAGDTILALEGRAHYVFGCDLSHSMTLRCRAALEAAGSSGNRLCSATLTDLPFKDESVQIITCFSVLQYLDDEQLRIALREFRRVLVDGGTLVVLIRNAFGRHFVSPGRLTKLFIRYIGGARLLRRIRRWAGRRGPDEFDRSLWGYRKALRRIGQVTDEFTFGLTSRRTRPNRIRTIGDWQMRQCQREHALTMLCRVVSNDVYFQVRIRKDS